MLPQDEYGDWKPEFKQRALDILLMVSFSDSFIDTTNMCWMLDACQVQYQGLEMKCNAKIRLLFLPSWSFRSYGRDPHEYGNAILINQKEKA